MLKPPSPKRANLTQKSQTSFSKKGVNDDHGDLSLWTEIGGRSSAKAANKQVFVKGNLNEIALIKQNINQFKHGLKSLHY